MSSTEDMKNEKQQMESILSALNDSKGLEFITAEHGVYTLISNGIPMENVEGYDDAYFTFSHSKTKYKVTMKSNENDRFQIDKIEVI
ncbi:hypothetical protein [Domibacillus mangrovi]|uniref:Uncharacterized protein n=1 Tax=Domibacillus mangrovi TaxID=1714354 RepID=A0A1Q5P6E6_9BACI|nr:hypothetical protein [Domibacillus mangrovi]OKL37845.1 hypothetical protein BLL40_03195 [Domibacillus mangrovi]